MRVPRVSEDAHALASTRTYWLRFDSVDALTFPVPRSSHSQKLFTLEAFALRFRIHFGRLTLPHVREHNTQGRMPKGVKSIKPEPATERKVRGLVLFCCAADWQRGAEITMSPLGTDRIARLQGERKVGGKAALAQLSFHQPPRTVGSREQRRHPQSLQQSCRLKPSRC